MGDESVRMAIRLGGLGVWNGMVCLVLIMGITAALVPGPSVGFDGVAASRDSTAAIPRWGLPVARPGVVIVLENWGPSPVTEAALGFDLPPIDPAQTLDVRIGDPGSPTNVGELQFRGSSVSRTNPLPPGAVACVGPLSELVPGTEVDFEQVGWFGNGFSTTVSLTIIPDVRTLPFEWDHPAVPGGRLTGTWRFLSAMPPECEVSTSVSGTSEIMAANLAYTATAHGRRHLPV